jgi:hypothetical protein
MGERVVYASRWTPKRAHRGLALVFLRSLQACLQVHPESSNTCVRARKELPLLCRRTPNG